VSFGKWYSEWVHGGYAEKIAALEAQLPTERGRAVAGLRAVNEAWARSLLGVEQTQSLVAAVRRVVEGELEQSIAAQAVQCLQRAEEHQWEIGTWATGSGEGLASMAEVRALQIARAWLLCASAAPEETAEKEARELLREASEDPNRIAERHSKDIAALLARLSG
jgi:hypothetical protein